MTGRGNSDFQLDTLLANARTPIGNVTMIQSNNFFCRVNGQTRTLTDVRRIMATQHNFYARYIALLDKKKSHVANNDRLPSEAQYKKKLMTKKSKWKVEKNIPKAKMVAMHRIEDRRRLLEGKETNFTFHGQPVHKEKIERSRKRFRQSDGQEFDH